MKLLKTILLGILITTAIFAWVYFLANAYNIGLNPTEIYQNYTAYLIFLYVSLLLTYICTTTHSRINTITIAIVVVINFFRLASFFTQKILGISTREFYTLAILLLLALAITRIKYRIRYPLISIITLPCIIILLNHTLPLYANKPDFEWFYSTQNIALKTKIDDDNKTLQDAETKITLKKDNTEKTVLLSQWFEIIELWNNETQIIFSSKTGIQNTLAYITFPQGTIITLYPQSAITMTLPEVNIIQGKVNMYSTQGQEGYLMLTGNVTKLLINNTGDIQYLIDDFLYKRNAYFTEQIWWEIMLNHTVDKYIGRYINVANSANKIIQNMCETKYIHSLNPENKCRFWSFDQNKLNYDEFHTYLKYEKSKTFTESAGSTERIVRDAKKWRNSTNIKARGDTIKNIFGN